MANTDKLRWSATVSHDWISVIPSTGVGSQNVNITVRPVASVDDVTAGTVTFNCIDCGVTTSKKITVTRCACKPSSSSITYSNETVTVDECITAYTFDVAYTGTITYTEGCGTVPVNGTVPYKCVFYKNNTDKAKTHTFYYPENKPVGYATLTVNQAKGPCSCVENSCECYLVGKATADTVSSTATSARVTWPYSAITWATGATCEIRSSITENTSSTTVSFKAATCNDHTKTGTITWGGYKSCNLSTSSCTSNNVVVEWKVEQEKPSGCECGCSSLNFTGYTNISKYGGSTIDIGTYETDECINIEDASSSEEWIDSIDFSNGYITAYVDGNTNTGTRTATISVTYTANNGTCTIKTFEITQLGGSSTTCKIMPENKEFDCSGTTGFTFEIT